MICVEKNAAKSIQMHVASLTVCKIRDKIVFYLNTLAFLGIL